MCVQLQARLLLGSRVTTASSQHPLNTHFCIYFLFPPCSSHTRPLYIYILDPFVQHVHPLLTISTSLSQVSTHRLLSVSRVDFTLISCDVGVVSLDTHILAYMWLQKSVCMSEIERYSYYYYAYITRLMQCILYAHR